LSVHDLQIGGGLTCFAATVIAWWVARLRLARDRTHFVSEVLALVSWRWQRGTPVAGFWGSLVASTLLGGGALAFCLAAVADLATRPTLATTCVAVTGGFMIAILAFPLREVPWAKAATTGGIDLLHPFFAASFYVVASVAGLVVLWHAGPVGTVLAAAHLASSAALTVTVFVVAHRELGRAAWRPWYLPAVRVLLDLRPAGETDTEWVRRLQWPATLLIALDLGLAPTGW
jgi:hypothetical protein